MLSSSVANADFSTYSKKLVNNLINKFKNQFNFISNNNVPVESLDSNSTVPPTVSDPLLPSTSSSTNLARYGTINSNNQNNNNNKNNRNQIKTTTKTPRRLRSKVLFVLITILLSICIYASFQDDFLDVVEAGNSCGTCLSLLIPLQALAHVGDDAFVDFFVQGCIKLQIEDEDVCKGAVGTQAPILAHDLRSISLASYAAKHFCSTVFGLCPLQNVIPYSVQFKDIKPLENEVLTSLKIEGREGEVMIGKKARKQWISRGRKPFKVVHLSDVHIDRSYVPGSDATCSKNICCRNYGPHSVGPNITYPAGKFGDRNCDTPVDLVRSMLKAIAAQVPEKEFTIFTGDAVEAAVWLVDEKEVTEDLDTWYSEMQDISYPSFGNHDTAPVNSFPRSTSASANQSQWVFDLAAKDWEKWIGSHGAEQVKTKSGCYAVRHEGMKLRILSINTQYWYKQNFWLYDSDEPQWDPNGILSWMADELHAAEDAGERVWIIGHMPFGKVDALRDQSNYANQIFQRYHNTIAAHFYGHSHVDEFEIAYSDYSNRTAENANGITFISGALTPSSGNPVFRVYDVDPDTFEIMDFVPYIANQSEPSFQIEPIWKPYYSARKSYGSYLSPPLRSDESLSPNFWHRLTEKMESKNDRRSGRELFNLFNVRLSRGGKVEDCSTRQCFEDTICMMRSMRSESNCARVQPGFSFKDKKRDTEAVSEPDHKNQDQSRHNDFACEGPGLASMLRKLTSGLRKEDDENENEEGGKFLHFRDSAIETLNFYQNIRNKL